MRTGWRWIAWPSCSRLCNRACLRATSPGLYYTVLASFNGTNGSQPWGDLAERLDPVWDDLRRRPRRQRRYFSISTNGSTGIQDLYSFAPDYSGGANPYGSLTLSGSTLFGMTYNGGFANQAGNIFSMSTWQ